MKNVFFGKNTFFGKKYGKIGKNALFLKVFWEKWEKKWDKKWSFFLKGRVKKIIKCEKCAILEKMGPKMKCLGENG